MLWNKSLIFFLLVIISLFTGNLLSESPDPVRGKRGMVVSASNLASDVGVLILKRGGNAIDAAVAVGFALAVTYPSAGNIGGGGYMVIHLADGKNVTLDFRERAPLKAHKNMYLDSAGNYHPELSTEGITSTGVPGSVAGLIYALQKYGTMKLDEVIQPAISIAEDGFPLEYHLAESFQYTLKDFSKYSSSLNVFTKNGIPFKDGDIFKQPDLARTLKIIKEKGNDGFYKGEIADLIVSQSQRMNGYITHEDLEKYKVIEKLPVSGTYKDYQIISMPPSSSGGILLIQVLNILENFSFNKDDWNSSSFIHKLIEAFKYSYADRSKHLGDDDYYDVPVSWLISKEYAREITSRIGVSAVPSALIAPGQYLSDESEQTTHYSIVDQYGNAVSTTTTLNSGFGSKLVVEGAGFLLNNEMDDFSAKPGTPNQFGLIGSEANSIQPGKRMLSSMTPTIVLKDNKPILIAGSPGGSTIPTVVLQVILNYLDFGMDIQQAVNAPRIHHQWLPDMIYYEEYGLSKDVIDKLKEAGHNFGYIRVLGRADCISIDQNNNIFYGASDPRGNGKAAGF